MEFLFIFNHWIWGNILLILFLITHLFFTIRTKWIQRYTFKGFLLSFQREKNAFGEISPFSALTLSLSATVTTGSILGVATAIAIGGAGAVFWCWLGGILSMATKYSETLLCLKYRVHTTYGTTNGGCMYVLEHGIGQKWLGILFAAATVIIALLMGNMTQSHTISMILKNNFHITPFVTAILLTILAASGIVGGIKSITGFCKKFVPFMIFLYTFFCIFLLLKHYDYILPTFKAILKGAFSQKAIGGGFFGIGMVLAFRYGFSRGFFNSEAGFGSTSIIASAAKTKNPVQQALVNMSATFWDTCVISTLTGIVIVLSILKNNITVENFSGATLAVKAFNSIGGLGSILLLFGLIAFSYSALFSWYYCGEKALEYLLNKKISSFFKIIWLIVLFTGCITTFSFLQTVIDFFFIFMIFPNILALFLQNDIIVEQTKQFLWEKNLDTAFYEKK